MEYFAFLFFFSYCHIHAVYFLRQPNKYSMWNGVQYNSVSNSSLTMLSTGITMPHFIQQVASSYNLDNKNCCSAFWILYV